MRLGISNRLTRRVLLLAFSALTLVGAATVGVSSAGASVGYLSQFGSYGSGPGQFITPDGVAVDPATGDVYVSDGLNNRVEKFDASGTYLSQFGGSGSGDGQFRLPQGVAVDPKTSDVYVVDYLGHRVEKFDASGNYLSQFGKFGTGLPEPIFWAPYGIAVDPKTGDVYVADQDFNNGGVVKFDSSGTYLSQLGSYGTGPGQFIGPTYVAVDPATGDVYVADDGAARVEKFDSSGNYLSQFGSYGSGPGQFHLPMGIAVDPNSGHVYVSDAPDSIVGLSSRVEEFDSSGTYLSQFGSYGSGPGQFVAPIGIAVDPATSDVYVADGTFWVPHGNGRVEKFGQLDTDLALTNVPGNLTVDATGPTGTVVTYPQPTVMDEDMPLPVADCTPPSGTTFAIGTTTVSCTVSAPGDSNSPVSASFTVTVNGAATQLANLLTNVSGIAPGNSLAAKVQAAQAALAQGNIAAACGDLAALINQANAQSGKKLTPAQAQAIIDSATRIEAVIGC